MVTAQMIAPGNWRLSAQELGSLRMRLQEHRRFRLNQLRELADPSMRPQERCTAARVEVQAQLIAAAKKVLSDIEAALTRMNAGEYGSCQLCGDVIGLERLRIVPHTRRCARCHHAEEIGA